SSELVSGIPQIVLRARRPDGIWEPAQTISASSAGAIDPAVCTIPGGDLCVVWADARHGPQELYFRSRIRGGWTPERRLTRLPGFSRGPVIGADQNGSRNPAGPYSDGSGARLRFKG